MWWLSSNEKGYHGIDDVSTGIHHDLLVFPSPYRQYAFVYIAVGIPFLLCNYESLLRMHNLPHLGSVDAAYVYLSSIP